MKPSRHVLRGALVLALFSAACQQGGAPGGDDDDPARMPDDIADALASLPEAVVLMQTDDGVPTYIVGELAKVGDIQIDDAAVADGVLRPKLLPVLEAFRITADDLVLRKMSVDEDGHRHFRYVQRHAGLEVVGGDLVVHVDIKGAVYAVNGTARGDIAAELGATPIAEAQARARIQGDRRFGGLAVTGSRVVYIETTEGLIYKAYETIVEGKRGINPARDKVYVDQDSGDIVAVYPQIHFAENRRVHSASNGTTLPGTLRRSEGQAATTDLDVNAAYDNTGSAYEAYRNFWNRDSYDNAGASLISTVHYSSNYCNAFWDGSQMVYGDGNAAQGCGPLARSLDVSAHELTHAVTSNESNLVYSGEPGGMNEAMSDIFGAFVEAWVDGGKTGALTVSNDTWLVGEDVLAPALRFMCDPVADGVSKDLWTSTVGNVDVHYSSGIGNLAFCLMTKGGTHPRGKTTVNVPALGMDKAIRIFYKAQVDILTSTSKYATVRTATEQAATALGYDTATKDAVGCAWAAVGVGTAPATCSGTTPPPPPPPATDGVLTNGTPVTGISGAAGSDKYWTLVVPAGQTTLTISIAGGTGDSDLYVQLGSKPTTTAYLCRPYKDGNAETCTFTPPTAGTYHVMLRGYSAYSGVTLTGTSSATGGGSGDPYLTNGIAVTNLSGAASSAKYYRVATPAGRTLSVRISGGTGDADLYTRFGARPTTATYSCRPYLTGSTETCSQANTQAGDYYVMVRGYSAYAGLMLIASY
ncbi:MAG: M4 family metallopeptidase [Deltaproteobacteria bacterium]|nr:M4 family metallopeptidase [Deltaproteobacteria bacterium]